MAEIQISLLHATRGRVDGAIAARDLWLQAAEAPNQIEHVFAFDRDDTASVEGLGAYRHVIVEEQEKGCVAAWNLATRASKGHILIQLSDDWLPIPHWDRIVCDRFRDLSKPGVLRISDGRRVDDLLCMAIFTRPWLEEIGSDFLSPEYFGVYSDDEFSFRAYEAGVVIDARDIVLTHCHPNYDEKLAVDETHRRQNDEARLLEGRNLFIRRNPDAVGRWIHDWMDARYYLPAGHRAQTDHSFKRTAFATKMTASQLEKAEAALRLADDTIEEMTHSLSWRITRPLRWLKRGITKQGAAVRNAEDVSLARRIYQACPQARAVKRLLDRLRVGLAGKLLRPANSEANQLALDRMVDSRAHYSPRSWEIRAWPFIDVSFVTFNSARWLGPLLYSLRSQDYPVEKLNITFVDHGSTDDSLDVLEHFRSSFAELFNGFTITRQDNLGYGHGHDRAIRSTQHPLLLISNVDVEFRPETLTELVAEALNDDPMVAGWEPRQAPFEHPKHYDPVTRETTWQAHACVLLRRSAYESVGGYDPLIFMYAEDVELSYRLRSQGYRLRYCPRSVITHHTYADSKGHGKPLQLAGSAVGSTIVRLRYGSLRDKVVGCCLLVLQNLSFSERLSSSAKTLRRESAKVAANLKHFLSGRGPENAGFPLRLFDYELRREGASWRSVEVRESPMISIITRTHGGRNRDLLLKQAGASVFNQTYKNVEWVVVKDGGETRKPVLEGLLASHRPSAKALFIVSDGGGRSAAGNLGLERSSGEFACFLDDDDLLYADHVETLLAAVQAKGAVAAYSLAFEVHTKFGERGYSEASIQTAPLHKQPWDYEVLKDHNFIPIQALLFSRSLFAKRGGFDTSLDQLEDWNLWLRYGFGNSFEYVPKTTSIFRTPADANERAQRQEALHEAYFRAREAAFAALRNLGHQV